MTMLKIGDFSKLSRISIRMLRHYDEIGLLAPEMTDSFTGYRYYSEAQLTAANRITALKDMGFGLAVIAEMTRGAKNPEAFVERLLAKRAETEGQIDLARRRLRLLDTMVQRIREDDTAMNYNVTLKELPERYVASVRQRIPTYEQEGLLWKILMEETAPLHMQDGDPCYTMAVFHDGEYQETQVDVEVQKTVKGSYANTKNVVFKTEPALLIASATYQGGYDQMTAVNEAVANWVEDNGYVFGGQAFNIYHVSPYETQNPDEFVTEVCYPVKKK